jgi:hypothetical protein
MGRRWITLMTCSAVITFAAFASSARASHAGATADCGTAGTFTIKARTNSAGFESPAPDKAVLFEEGGVLTVRQLYVDGELVLTRGATPAPHEVTCSFTIGAGLTFSVIGTLAGV